MNDRRVRHFLVTVFAVNEPGHRLDVPVDANSVGEAKAAVRRTYFGFSIFGILGVREATL